MKNLEDINSKLQSNKELLFSQYLLKSIAILVLFPETRIVREVILIC
jgi:hypothetical protein